MHKERDPYEFELALLLHKTVGEIRSMSNAEYVEWQAYFKYQKEMEDLRKRSEGG